MKNFMMVIGATALSCLAGAAQAQTWYAGGYGGLNLAHDGTVNGTDNVVYDLGFGIGGIAGYNMGNGLRLEGEFAYRANDIETIDGVPVGANVSSTAVMVNALFDIGTQTSFKPHIGGGLGIARGTIESVGLSFTDTALAGQIIFGVDYMMAPDLALLVDYRFFFTEDLGFGAGFGLGGLEYSNSSISAGLRKTF